MMRLAIISMLVLLVAQVAPAQSPTSQATTGQPATSQPAINPPAPAEAVNAQAASGAVAQPAPAGPQPLEHYRLLSQRNIFLRNRVEGAAAQSDASSAQTAPSTPEAATVLTGLVQQDQSWVAFFEDTRTGQMSRVAAGQAMVGGTVASVCLDSVTFDCQGASRVISLGQNLEGTQVDRAPPTAGATSSPASAQAPASGAAANSSASPAPSSSQADILERMRQRRAQEVKR